MQTTDKANKPILSLKGVRLKPYSNDHRGHGRTARSPKELGDFGPGGFRSIVKDMVQLSLKARKENPNQPFIHNDSWIECRNLS